MMRLLLKSSLFLLLILSVSCFSSDGRSEKTWTVSFGEVSAEITCELTGLCDKAKFEGQLFRLFEHELAELDASCLADGRMEIIFNEPVYINEIKLKNSVVGKLEKEKEKELEIEVYGADEMCPPDCWAMERMGVRLGEEKNFKATGHYYGLLRARGIGLVFHNSDKLKIVLNEFELNFTDSFSFEPTISLTEIVNKHMARWGNKWWKLKDASKDSAETRIALEKAVIKNLVFLGLSGNIKADKLLHSYNPQSTSSGEWASQLISWYNFTKAYNEKMKTQ